LTSEAVKNGAMMAARLFARLADFLTFLLWQEEASWKDDIYPLHHMERNAYLSAIHKAMGALSEARIVLSQATLRLSESKPTP
jgi:hypothetical protein